MKRRIVQISAIGSQRFVADDLSEAGEWEPSQVVYALCDDGTVWANDAEDGDWYQLSDIPQDGAA